MRRCQPSVSFLKNLGRLPNSQRSQQHSLPLESSTQGHHDSARKQIPIGERVRNSLWFVGLELIALLFLLPTAIVLVVDLEDRQSERVAQAWTLLSQRIPGSGGKRQALEYLNSQSCPLKVRPSGDAYSDIMRWLNYLKMCKHRVVSEYPRKTRESLNDIDLSADALGGRAELGGANLSEARLGNANLKRANLSGANLTSANLSNANLERAALVSADLSEAALSNANLSRAFLTHANLSGADLSGVNLNESYLIGADLDGANLTDANLSRVDLSDANLSRADLSGANFSKAYGLLQSSLNKACGDDSTQLDAPLTIPDCPEPRQQTD